MTSVYSKNMDGVGYIQIASFDEATSSEFEKAYNELRTENIKSLILDLRDNGGGIYEEAVKIAYQLAYESCLNDFAEYTQAQPGQEFSKDGGAWTLCYKSAYLKDGKLHIKGYVTNNTSEEMYIHYYNLDVTTRIIHDGAQTDSPWMSEFTAPEQYMVDYDTICVPAGETIAIESVSSEHYGQVHFAGISFTVIAGYGPDGRPTGEEEKAYWIDFSEYLN